MIVGRASTAPDRDSGLQLPPQRVRILTPDSAADLVNAGIITVPLAVGCIPRLNSGTFASKLCKLPPLTRPGLPCACGASPPCPSGDSPVCQRVEFLHDRRVDGGGTTARRASSEPLEMSQTTTTELQAIADRYPATRPPEPVLSANIEPSVGADRDHDESATPGVPRFRADELRDPRAVPRARTALHSGH